MAVKKPVAPAPETTTAEPVAGDQVAMLSLNADGTPDQTAPTFVIDEAEALEATKAQLTQQALSAAEIDGVVADPDAVIAAAVATATQLVADLGQA